MSKPTTIHIIPTATIVITLAIIFIVGNDSMRPDLMEVRNLVTAREMVYDHHVMVPTMNGEIRLEKPPLPTWIAAMVEYISPDNINMQRGVAALMAMLWTMWLYMFVYRITQRRKTAIYTILLFATCYPVILHARTATWDVFCHAFMMGAIYYIYRALYEDTHIVRNFVLGGALFGLSFMSKGPVSPYALFLPFIISMVWYRTPSLKGKAWPLIGAIAIAMVIGGWWYAYVRLFEPEAMSHVINKESTSWINHNVRPWFYYWRFFLETGIWSILMLTTMVLWFKRKNFLDDTTRRQWTFAMLWVIVALVLLSLMPEKKMRYLLPMMVPCSLSMVYALEYISKGSMLGRIFFAINKWALTIICLALPVVAYIFIVKDEAMGMFIFVVFSLGCVGFAFYTARIRHARLSYRIPPVVYAMFVWVVLFIMPNINSIFGNTSSRNTTCLKDNKAIKQLPMYYVNKGEHQFRIDMVYQTHHKIKELESVALIDSAKQEFKQALPMPCALLTDSATASTVTAIAHKKQYTVVNYGKFDDNISKRNRQHYKEGLCNYLLVLKHSK